MDYLFIGQILLIVTIPLIIVALHEKWDQRQHDQRLRLDPTGHIPEGWQRVETAEAMIEAMREEAYRIRAISFGLNDEGMKVLQYLETRAAAGLYIPKTHVYRKKGFEDRNKTYQMKELFAALHRIKGGRSVAA